MKANCVCQGILSLLAFACVWLYHWSLILLLPAGQHFSERLQESFEAVLGFENLEVEAAAVLEAAANALQACGVPVSPGLPCDSSSLASVAYREEAAVQSQLQVIQESFQRTLATILDVCVDPFLSTAAVPFDSLGLELGAILSSVAEVEGAGASCAGASPAYCRIHRGASEVLASVLDVMFGVAGIYDSGPLREYARWERWVWLAHVVPYLSVVPFSLLCATARHRGRGKLCTLCAVLLRASYFLPLVFAPSTLLCATVVDARFHLDLLPVAVFGQDVTLGYVCGHMSSEWPDVWQHLFGDVGPGLDLFSISVLCLEVFVVLLAFQSLRESVRRRPTPEDLVQEIQQKGAWPSTPPKDELCGVRRLQPCQVEALVGVRQRCRELHSQAMSQLSKRAYRLGFSEAELASALAFIRERAPIIIHLDLETYGPQLANDTHYRNQFETGTSGGTKCLRRRACWEDDLFSDAYAGAAASHRCKYGVLNVVNDPQGVRACRQYGCSYLLLRGVRLRTTFTPFDSAGLQQEKLATVDYYAHVFNEYEDAELSRALSVGTARAFGTDSQVLRSYKEAQIHGEVCLADHVEIIMAHPSLRRQGHTTHTLSLLAKRCNAQVVWIEGGIDVPPAPADPGMVAGAASAATAPRRSSRSRDDLDAAVRLSLSTGRASRAQAEPLGAGDILEVRTDSGWQQMDAAVLAAIGSSRTAWQGKVCFAARGFTYELDFDSGVQRNLQTGACRHIRSTSRAAGADSSASAAAATDDGRSPDVASAPTPPGDGQDEEDVYTI